MPAAPVDAVNPSPSERVTVLGSEVPAFRSGFADEYQALTQSAALLPMPWEVSLQVMGKDAGAFLQNLLTQDVIALAHGDSVAAALASRKGHLEADLRVARDGEAFRIRLQRRLLEVFTQSLDRYRIVEDVQWRADPEPQACFLLAGPRASEIWKNSGCDEFAHVMITPEISPEDVFLTLPQSAVPDLEARICAWTDPRVPTIGWEAFNVARIEVGRAWFGIDADEDRLVPEPGFADRISYDKGCYLGQETLARLHYRGQLNWKIEPLCFDPELPGADAAQAGAELLREGVRVGWLTSVGVTPLGKGVALGYLHRKVRESSGTFSLSSGLALSSGSTLTCRVDSTKVETESFDPHPGKG